jgi:hypothetical protein
MLLVVVAGLAWLISLYRNRREHPSP